jgi:hypothetical protein
VPAIADAVEARDPILAARHRLAVDDAGARAQAGEGLDDEREALGQVIARPAVEPQPPAIDFWRCTQPRSRTSLGSSGIDATISSFDSLKSAPCVWLQSSWAL